MYDVFSLPKTTFPKDFIWGSATAGHQIEGDNVHSNWWHKEQQEDFYKHDPERKYRAPSGKACDGYRLYKQDIDMLVELGHQAFRMSVEWSRIEPAEGQWNDEAVRHYIEVLDLLKSKNIRPFVTLHHFTHPQWFEEKGAFMKRENIRYFERFIEYIVPKISRYVDNWNVINEFNLWGGAGSSPEAGPVKFNYIKAHAMGYHVIKKYSQAPVSSAHAYVHWFPRRYHDDLDRRMTAFADFTTNEFFFHALRTGELVFPNNDAEYAPDVKGAIDYWAVNYYTRHMVDARKAGLQGPRFAHKELKMIPMNFYLEEMYPEGLTANIERLADRPVYITENGCSADDDRFRIVYIALYLSALAEAIERGVDVRGYLYWSLMDNYEWGSFVPRFGMVDVDFKTFKRTPKPSAYFFRDIIRQNGFDSDTIRRYLKELPTLK